MSSKTYAVLGYCAVRDEQCQEIRTPPTHTVQVVESKSPDDEGLAARATFRPDLLKGDCSLCC